jgi:hypothetical protein
MVSSLLLTVDIYAASDLSVSLFFSITRYVDVIFSLASLAGVASCVSYFGQLMFEACW